ncbi:extracellular solute-binding protein [Vallitalea pronyensis]|uniref:Extracellular solute-binding protein n=1 Tax=Vallitalea pronyensis TaxID=1348613 RepID=A0A8J8SIT3_9FIRM|nr:extracellular solute-binding protein [Vallitalea pronyensis]QUI24777.1 extracellular solute-binding protein [Vallitalea pronyensis]
MKKHNFRSILALLLVAMMVIGSFTGCGNAADETEDTSSEDSNVVKDSDKDDDKDSQSTQTSQSRENTIQFPLEEQVTLTCFVHTRPFVDDFDNNPMTKYIEEKTNIDLQFEVVNGPEAEQKLNLALSTGTYPDIILVSQLTKALQNLYGEQGILLPMDELMKDNGKQAKAVLEKYPDIEAFYTAKDGHLYNLPRIYDVTYSKCLEKVWIYKPWLDKLNLDLPTTTEEFYQVLKAFKEQDPNGNGKPDEIPMAGTETSWAAGVRNFLMNAFVYYPQSQGGASYLYVDNGKVIASYLQDGYKEGIKYMRKLVDEGLLSTESFTQDSEGFKRMGENPEDVILGCFPGGFQGVALDMTGDRWKDYVAVEPLQGPQGVRYTKYAPDSIYLSGFSITDKCEHPDIAMALADFLYSEELSIFNFDGAPDVDWKYVQDESKLGINGEPAVFERLHALEENQHNFSWSQLGNAAYVAESMYTDDPENIQVMLYKETKKKYLPHIPPMDMILKQYIYSEEESADMMIYATAINAFLDQMSAAYILGDHMDWENFEKELMNMGVQSYIDIFQRAYDKNN